MREPKYPPNGHGLFSALPVHNDCEDEHSIIGVHSLDADGAFLPQVFFDPSESMPSMHTCNQDFFTWLNKSYHTKSIFLVGSNRQDPITDLFALRRTYKINNEEVTVITDSYFYAICEFVKKHHEQFCGQSIELDKFLLPDIFHAKKIGETFEDAMLYRQELYDSQHKPKPRLQEACTQKIQYFVDKFAHEEKILHDTSKFCLLYAQIQHIVSKNQGKKIQFHFYDDKIEILQQLLAVFKQASWLIPENVTLHLHRYEDGKFVQQNMGIVLGQGKHDEVFCDTVKNIRECFIQYQTQALKKLHNKDLYAVDGNVAEMFFKCVPQGDVLVATPRMMTLKEKKISISILDHIFGNKLRNAMITGAPSTLTMTI